MAKDSNNNKMKKKKEYRNKQIKHQIVSTHKIYNILACKTKMNNDELFLD